jgi:hypothetical protein
MSPGGLNDNCACSKHVEHDDLASFTICKLPVLRPKHKITPPHRGTRTGAVAVNCCMHCVHVHVFSDGMVRTGGRFGSESAGKISVG